MNAPPHAMKYQNGQWSQTEVPKLPVHGEGMWGGGKKMQNLLLLHPGKVDLQVLPWGTRCSRDKAP